MSLSLVEADTPSCAGRCPGCPECCADIVECVEAIDGRLKGMDFEQVNKLVQANRARILRDLVHAAYQPPQRPTRQQKRQMGRKVAKRDEQRSRSVDAGLAAALTEERVATLRGLRP